MTATAAELAELGSWSVKNGWTQDVLAEARVPGAVVQLVNSLYDPGAAPVRHHSSLMLRLRVWPKKTDVRAWLGRGSAPGPCGELMLFPPSIETGALGPDHPTSMRCLAFTLDPSWLESFTGMRMAGLPENPQIGLDFRDAHIEQAMWRIYPEMLRPDAFSDAILQSCCQVIAIDLGRRFAPQAERQADAGRQAFYDQRIRLVEDMLAGDWQDFRPAASLAEELGIGAGYLRALYRNATGSNLEDAIEEARIKHVKRLLGDLDVPVKVIAFDMGYTTHSAFSAAFKKVVGISPRQYRNHRVRSQ